MVRLEVRRYSLVVLSALIFLCQGAAPAFGTAFRSGENVLIGAEEVIDDDLYAVGETVIVDGLVTGDLVTCGASVTLNGSVEGDLIGCGQAVVINGTVGDDVRVAGMAVKLGALGQIGDDLVAGSYSLETEEGSRAEGGLLFAGYQARLAGAITEGFRGTMNGLELLGSVGGDVEIEVEGGEPGPSPAQFFPSPVPMPVVKPGLSVLDSAQVSGTLTYTASTDGEVAPGAQLQSGITREEPEAGPEEALTPQARVLKQVRRYLTLFIVGLLLLWIAPRWTGRLAESIRAKPLPTLGWGALSLGVFVVGILALAVAAILIGILVGYLTLGKLLGLVVVLGLFAEATWVAAFWLAVSFLAPIVVGLLLGKWLLKRTLPDRADGRLLPLGLGLLVLAILTAIPYLGPFVGFVVVLLGIGALWFWGVAACRPEPAAAG